MTKLTQERLKEALDYDPATGVFRWSIRPSNKIHIGDVAGVVGTNGRRFIMVDGEKFQAHRLAWFYVHGVWPDGDLKQKNGNYDDCSLENLMPISRIEQARLRSTLSTNTTGFRGVSPAAKGGWKASVTANYHQIILGVFPTKEEASARYEHAMAILADAKTPEECEIAAQKIIQFRRKSVAWARLNRSSRRHDWTDIDHFFATIGEMNDEEGTVAALDESRPIGPENFRWLLRVQGKFDYKTKEGMAAYMKAYRDANPGRWRHNHLKTNYNIDEVEFHAMKQAQNGICLICESGSVDENLAIDHCHKTGKLRGLLCKQCNFAMGQFGDNASLLRRAAEFLDGNLSANKTPDYVTNSPNRDWLVVASLGFGA